MLSLIQCGHHLGVISVDGWHLASNEVISLELHDWAEHPAHTLNGHFRFLCVRVARVFRVWNSQEGLNFEGEGLFVNVRPNQSFSGDHATLWGTAGLFLELGVLAFKQLHSQASVNIVCDSFPLEAKGLDSVLDLRIDLKLTSLLIFIVIEA